jgi:hypothetical protein
MKQRTIRGLKYTVALLSLAGLFLFAGCSNDNPLANDNPINKTAQSDRGEITFLTVDQNKMASLHKDAVDSSTFYAEAFIEAKHGGKLEIKDDLNGNSKVEIKKDALPSDMTVVFKWTENNIYAGSIYNKNAPQTVINFSEPVKVTLMYKWADMLDVDEGNLGLYFYNTASNSWDKVACDINTDKYEIKAEFVKSGKFRILQEVNGGLLEFHKRDPEMFYASKFIKAKDGGKIELGDGDFGKSKIVFEKYDLPYDETIEFEWAADGTIDGTFAPHGIYFNNPVRVEFSYKLADVDGFNEDDLRVFYFNEDTQIWEYVGGEVDTHDKVVVVYLEHFSRYAVAYGR